MHQPQRTSIRLLARERFALAPLACALACAALLASARAPQEQVHPAVEDARGAAQTEMRELFDKVERRLREIDRLLSDAGAGDTSAVSKVGKSGIDELLKNSQVRQREVIEGIDRILELARMFPDQQSGPPQQGGSEGQQGGQGQSPLDKQGEQRTDREQTPSTPQSSEQSGGQANKPEPTKPKPDPSGKDPHDPSASKDPNARNAPANAPAAPSTQAPNASGNDKDRWGDLPVHARDVFRTEGGGDMPVQYRDWIDAYYRRLNRKP